MNKFEVQITVHTFDGVIQEHHTTHKPGISTVWVEYEDSSEQRLHAILTEFFPQWQYAEWDYEHDMEAVLWAKIVTLKIDGEYAHDILEARPIVYLEHPLEDLEKQFELRLNETYLAVQGITELKRDDY